MVVETHSGSWGPAAQKIFSDLAQAKSMITGELKSDVLTQLYQNLGVTLHRENARVVVKRMRRFSHNLQHITALATTLQSVASEAASRWPT